MSRSRPRIGWLAPEDCTLPPADDPGSITTVIWETALRLGDRYELVVAARDGVPDGTANCGISFLRAGVARDRRRGAVIEVANKFERKLGLRDLPYAGRTSYFRSYARAQAAQLRAAGVELVHLHNTTQWVPWLRATMPSTPVVVQMHGEWLTEIPDPVARARLAQIDRVVAVSEQVARAIRTRHPEHAERVVVVPNGVDTERFRPRAAADAAPLRQRLGLDAGPVVLFVGRLSAEKALHVLLDALPQIAASVPDVQLVLAGPAHGLRSPLPTRERRELQAHPQWRARYSEELRRRAARVPGRVHFAGLIPQPELPLLYALADVYVQPSLFEAFGMPVVEAMASGVPVVVSDGGALPELVADGRDGVVVPAEDARALAAAVVGVVSDRRLAQRLGAAGREKVARELAWRSVADRLAAVYDGVLAEGARAS